MSSESATIADVGGDRVNSPGAWNCGCKNGSSLLTGICGRGVVFGGYAHSRVFRLKYFPLGQSRFASVLQVGAAERSLAHFARLPVGITIKIGGATLVVRLLYENFWVASLGGGK